MNSTGEVPTCSLLNQERLLVKNQKDTGEFTKQKDGERGEVRSPA